MSAEQESPETPKEPPYLVSTESPSGFKPGPPSPEAELTEGFERALIDLEIRLDDMTTVSMVGRAARLSPEDDQPAISATRLFEAAVYFGRGNRKLRSYSAALARVIRGDANFLESFRNIERLFKTDSAEVALERLRTRWFSDDVQGILRAAVRDRGDLPSSDAIVRTLVRYPSPLRDRINLDRLADAIEEDLQKARTDTPLTVLEEIGVQLEALKVPVTDAVRWCLLAAAGKSGTRVLDVDTVMDALVETDHDHPGLPTDPTEILKDLVRLAGEERDKEKLSSRPMPPLDLPADPENPLRFSTELDAALERGLKVQQRIFLNPVLGTKGLIAAAFTWAWDSATDRAGLVTFVERLQEIIRQRLPEIEARRWNRALERETSTLPRLNADQPGIGPQRDMLGIRMDALAIANVAAGKSTSLPLAFGIFGDWGAGKSFFMRLLQEQIAGFVRSDARDDGFEHAIVQIQFNAWHYAETNLWASLVGHIFEELDRWMTRDQKSESTAKADAILGRLSTARQLTLEAATELMQRRREHAKAGGKLTEAQAALAAAEKTAAEAPEVAWSGVVRFAKELIAKDPEMKQQLAGIESTLAVPALTENKVTLTNALEQLDKSTSAGRAALGALRSTLGNGQTIALAIAFLVGVPLLLFCIQWMLSKLSGQPHVAEIGSGVQALAGLLAAATLLVKDFTKRAKSLADGFVALKASIDAEIVKATAKEREAAQAEAANVAKSAAAVEQAKTVVRATGEQVAAALKEYAEETGSLRISRFVRARAGDDGYRKHLGLVSTIRKDFDQLESLMLDRKQAPAPHLEEARKHYQARVNALLAEARKDKSLEEDEITRIAETTGSMREVTLPEAMEFRRIVLYIDDLDRCEPAKVVEVLQAVNMLLTFKLFVVMVAVDARWLSRSLEKQYPEFFGVGKGDDEEEEDSKAGVGNGRPERATTADYLEKIFQIPYWVPAMNEATSKALVEDLVAADRVSQPAQGRGTETTPASPPADTPVPDSMRLTQAESDAFAELAPYLGMSPSRVRRFDKAYRFVKASLPPGEVEKLEAGGYRALATQLAIATGAPNAFAAWVEICASADDASVDRRIADLKASEDERKNVAGALAVFRKMSGNAPDALKQLAAQSARAAEDYQPTTMEPPTESLSLTKDEIESLTELSPFLGGSPRRARRFVNVYRVAKASLTPGEIAKLEAGEHKALATQLAIATGAPNAFAAWMEICAEGDEASAEQRAEAIDAGEDECENITKALAAFRKMAANAPDSLKQLDKQSKRACRFSFAMPGKAAGVPPLPVPLLSPPEVPPAPPPAVGPRAAAGC